MSSNIPVHEVRRQETLGPSGSIETTSEVHKPLLIQVSTLSESVLDFPLPSKRLGPEQLYADDDDSYIAHVLGILRRVKAALGESLKLDPTREFNEFEQQMMIAKAFIDKAHKSREIGVGFTAIVNAIRWALANRDSDPLTKKQIHVLMEAVNRVSWSPYMHFDTAMPLLDSMEEAELNIESPYLEMITEQLDV
jgi:hypothetical protein